MSEKKAFMIRLSQGGDMTKEVTHKPSPAFTWEGKNFYVNHTYGKHNQSASMGDLDLYEVFEESSKVVLPVMGGSREIVEGQAQHYLNQNRGAVLGTISRIIAITDYYNTDGEEVPATVMESFRRPNVAGMGMDDLQNTKAEYLEKKENARTTFLNKKAEVAQIESVIKEIDHRINTLTSEQDRKRKDEIKTRYCTTSTASLQEMLEKLRIDKENMTLSYELLAKDWVVRYGNTPSTTPVHVEEFLKRQDERSHPEILSMGESIITLNDELNRRQQEALEAKEEQDTFTYLAPIGCFEGAIAGGTRYVHLSKHPSQTLKAKVGSEEHDYYFPLLSKPSYVIRKYGLPLSRVAGWDTYEPRTGELENLD